MVNQQMNPYCAAIPPKPEGQTANCVLVKGHAGWHKNVDRLQWANVPEPESAGSDE